MKIIARIEKIAGTELYLFNGDLFGSFLEARRKMTEMTRTRQRRFKKPAEAPMGEAA